MNKVGIFVDLSNLYYSVKSRFQTKIDFARYRDKALCLNSQNKADLYRAYAYGAQINNEANGFLDRLQNQGYTIRFKKPKEWANPIYKINIDGIEKIIINHCEIDSPEVKSMVQIRDVIKARENIRKANWDIGIAVDVVRLVSNGKLDTVVLGSADGDFAELVDWIKERGCRCVIFACNIANELKSVADDYIEIDRSILEK